jgi:hypothetical protein
MATRLCREAHLQGFWLETEQYGNYRWRTKSGVPEFETHRPANLKFPLGKDSPDAVGYEPLQGSIPFLDGVLDGIEPPGQLIHGYENTFYHSQGPIFERSGVADMALSEKSPYLGGVRVMLSLQKRP